MKKILTLSAAIFIATSIFAQTTAEQEAIKAFCGCFEVDFKYKETFAADKNYEFHEPYSAKALELIFLEEESPTKMVLQHVLVINDTFFIKHWRQDWEYQSDQLFSFTGNKTWDIHPQRPGTTNGQWSQEVYGTDDTPRYSGSATWFLADGKRTWENTSDTPLPRREYKKRSDYDLLRRTNGLIITDQGWIHEQDNQKIVLTDSGEQLLVEEKGRNTYVRTDPQRCEKAKQWWESRRGYWKHVRQNWDEWLSQPGQYKVEKRQGKDFLPYELAGLEDQDFESEAELQKSITAILKKYRTRVEVLSNE
jgi:hypothetical protein